MSIGCLYAGTFGYREYQISQLDMQIFRHIDSFFMARDILSAMGIRGFITYYIFITALVMGFLLIGLSWWHGRMIGRGETSVERIINEDYLHPKDLMFVNNYDINRIENWKRFFGVRTVGEFIRRVLLPSTHKPNGNGVIFNDYEINSNLFLHRRDSGHSSYASTNNHSLSKRSVVNIY